MDDDDMSFDFDPDDNQDDDTVNTKMLLEVQGKFRHYIYGANKAQAQVLEQTALPINIIIGQLQKKLADPNDNRLYFLKAGTGAGKSTFFINELHQRLSNGNPMLCTKPKVKLCLDPMQELPQYYPRFMKGVNLGYKVGGAELMPSAQNHVLFCTTQILSNMLIGESPTLFSYRFLIIDEVHDMSEQMLGLLFQLKQFIKNNLAERRARMPIIICMSATINLDKFINYFDVGGREFQEQDIGFIIPSGMKYPVEEQYFKDGNLLIQRLEKALDFVKEHYHKNSIWTQEYRDILIFTKGNPTMSEFVGVCSKYKFGFPVKVFSYARIDEETKSENYNLFHAQMPSVKIIISTTLLEAGANIPNLYCVIDTAIRQQMLYNNIIQESSIQSSPVSQSTIDQRKGRVGRNGPGMYIGLYDPKLKFQQDDTNPFLLSKQIFKEMFVFIKNIMPHEYDPTFVVDLQDIDLLEPVNADVVNSVYTTLMELKLISTDGHISKFLYDHVFDNYDTLIKSFGILLKCNPYDAALIAVLAQREVRIKKRGLQILDVVNLIRNGYYDYFDQQNISDILVQVYDTVQMWKHYPKVEYEDNAYKRLVQLFLK